MKKKCTSCFETNHYDDAVDVLLENIISGTQLDFSRQTAS